ncbi:MULTISPECIES: TIM barrel protein [Streptomyces]|uniref:Xylose isomerase n=3 Tax=Streptomyces TaxID=1883 RepID=A0A3R7I235_9ACTN|nr:MULTISPECIES: TIM barrel protein [Streptomyces]KNE84303.1 xylose isomerase [Streptomyces fradiae]OFA58909.1 xylose isomerase [Streptomyces fradiae]PQM22159.1 xylose isomerase [Streptomyces xinghaiensis]RKM95410.1 sugar phosphate isomerase/epimerase [Streptomyces xinghaiensis]RNC72994.1 sugar phosphate isomerase/epimerase [Streptomyces xinghaiensis]
MQNSTAEPTYGAGIWHFATYVDRYATDGYGEPRTVLDAIELAGKVGNLSVVDLNWPFPPGDISTAEVRAALVQQGLRAIAVTPEIYTGKFAKGGFTHPDPAVRRDAIELVAASAEVGRELGVDYVKLWPGQDGYDYPFQADYTDLWDKSVGAVRELAQQFPDMRFAIEYKPREPRNRMVFSSLARTLLAIEDMSVDNVGVLLDFGHSLYGGETPAEAARMAIRRDKLFAIDVNDNFRGWDDDMVVGSVHLLETFEFFFALRDASWDGVWQLDQFPFREDPVEAARTGIRTMRAFHRALARLDREELASAQARQDALAAQAIAKRALYRALAESETA